jgi:hypothetical protein
MKSTKWFVGSMFMTLAMGCGDPRVDGGARSRARTMPASAEPAASPASLELTEAERALDRGQDAAAAKAALEKVLGAGALTADEKSRAVLALSRAEEALGNKERATALVEEQIAAHANDHDWSAEDDFHARLRKLLTGHESVHDIRLGSNETVAPFAHVLLKYFPPVNAKGTIEAKFFMAGGDDDVSRKLGTYNLRGAYRDEKEKECPLCDLDVDVGRSIRQSSWMVIPESQSKFGEAMTVFYFDLGRGRIPARYEGHLPMKVGDIVRELEAGKSFVVAKERPGAPPALLMAAPRTAMLEDVEAKVAQLTELPLTPVFFDVGSELRPSELRGVMRGSWRIEARKCHETLVEGRAGAHGHADINISLAADGRVTSAKVESREEALRDATFSACIAKAAEKLEFPATGKNLTVVVPLELRR